MADPKKNNVPKTDPKKIGSYYTSYAQSNEKAADEERRLIGSNLNFAVREAYKQLRTNIEFSFTDDKKCRVIGMTSSIRGEGKSLTSLNLAYSLAEAGKAVLLIEGDMRIPTLGKKMKVRNTIGLSNMLIGQCEPTDVIRRYSLEKGSADETSFHVMLAGDTPPNPSELLGSERMQDKLSELKRHYDYILFDLPPVTAVTDAVVVARYTDGVVLLVRQEYSERGVLNETIRQLEQADVKILGFVFNVARENGMGYSKGYRHRYYYGKGYSRYYQNTDYYKKGYYQSPDTADSGADKGKE